MFSFDPRRYYLTLLVRKGRHRGTGDLLWGQNSWSAWWPGCGCTTHICISFSSMALEVHAGYGGEQGDLWLSCLLSCPTRSHYQHSRKICQKASFFSDVALVQPPTCYLTDLSKNWPHHWNIAKITSELTLDYSLLWHKFLQITGNQQNQVSNDALKISI